jgi:hypothetical protein
MVTETLTRPAPVIGTSPTYDVVDAEATEETPPLMVPPEAMPQIDHLITEDDTPVDNVFSEKQQRLLTEPLHSTWRQTMTQDRPFVVFANVGLFYTTRKQAVVPDEHR